MESWRSNKSHKQRNDITPLQKIKASTNNQNDESSSGDLKKRDQDDSQMHNFSCGRQNIKST
jgi:hypothetical protein